jgi:Leucine-rich repeat (LRR) protein
MIKSLLLIYLCTFLTHVHTRCLWQTSQTWICYGQSKLLLNQSDNIDYQTILNNERFERFILTDYDLKQFKIKTYPSTLILFNATGNSFQSLVINAQNRFQSNLRHLILESNQLEQIRVHQVILPESLERISLANNRLEVLDARLFFRLVNLTELDLSNNRLKRILPQLLLRMSIRLNRNPLDCLCTPEFYRIVCEKATTSKLSTVRICIQHLIR